MITLNDRRIFPTLLTAAVLLAACSDSTVEQSSDFMSAAADVHDDAELIARTKAADADREGTVIGNVWNAAVFETETELVEQDVQSASDSADVPVHERRAFYGDLHVHTTNSFDGHAFGTMATPADAYRFAKGEPIRNAGGFDMQLSRPLDFYSVTDHGMFLGLVKAASDTTTEFSKTAFAQPYHNLNAPENNGTDVASSARRLGTFSSFLPNAIGGIRDGTLDRDQVLGVVRSAWQETIDAAESFNDPGNFTTFVGYEYTSSTANMGNLHRNVIFKGSDKLPREPFSRFHSVNPEDLWQWMDELRSKGVESLAIPHNSNGSNGQMFKLVDWAGDPLDDDYSKQRMRNEPIVEITQIKGTSETHPRLSSRDEWAGFEIMPYRVATNVLSKIEGSYVREALLNGLTLEQEGMTNPYQFGFIGSSDTHTGASQNDESDFVSKLGLLSSTPEQRGSVPRTGIANQFAYYWTKFNGGANFVKINGGIYGTGATPTFGASGLAAAWAEENTRDSLYDAFRRKEVFATSGPRIALRFFAGFGFDESMLSDADGVQQAYEKGISMGSDIVGESADSPQFLVMASADPQGAPLQRLQIIKGWIDDKGTHEEVIDIACAGGAKVDASTNRCPDNGAKVNLSDCSINPETGSGQLSALWQDPEFEGSKRAFYYARVIENPTCRWSTWDAIRAGVDPRPDLARTLQERAWSSPIHYLPN